MIQQRCQMIAALLGVFVALSSFAAAEEPKEKSPSAAGLAAKGPAADKADDKAADKKGPDYNRQIAPILRKYCGGCHNADDSEGELVLSSYQGILKGGENGAVVTAGRSDLSRLVRVLSGDAEPAMPPEDNEQPSPAQIALLKSWIDAGAKGPAGAEPDPTVVMAPKIARTAPLSGSINAVAISPRGDLLAVARYGYVELLNFADHQPLRKLAGHRGGVKAIGFTPDGASLIAAAGEAGLFGEVRIWNVADGKLRSVIKGHKDSIYAMAISPDGKQIATGGYDHGIALWDIANGKLVRTFDGHNGAVFGLAFRPDGKILASASGDRTVKLWNVVDGVRLDTLKESVKELYSLAFSPDGRRVAAAGVDNRIRIWSVSQSGKEGSNPLLYSQYAHEAPILRIVFSQDGGTLISTAEDRLVKIWNASAMTIRATLPLQSDWVASLAISPDSQSFSLGRLDGSLENFQFAAFDSGLHASYSSLSEVPPEVDYGQQPAIDKLSVTPEKEPNNTPDQAQPLALPGVIEGAIFASEGADADLYRIEAQAGDQWIIETNAARSKSPLDSKIEVLHGDGQGVLRLLLRAERDTEIEFRGMNSNQRGARLKNWREIPLNKYIYLGGEVVKHYRQRRGPDSDSQFYPEGGNRFTFFDTTARAHAFGEPGYVVIPYPVGTEMPNNGLPVFPVYFENDDQSQRKFGKDSQVSFMAPKDGPYLIRVSDVRGFSGEDFKYKLIVRRPQPDFKVSLSGAKPTVNAGSGKSFSVKAERIDNFNGPIRVDISGLPPGYTATSPIVIQEGLYTAKAVINALPGAPKPTEANWAKTKVTATAMIAGKERSKDVNNLGTIKLAERPKVIAYLYPTGGKPNLWNEADFPKPAPKEPAKKEKPPEKKPAAKKPEPQKPEQKKTAAKAEEKPAEKVAKGKESSAKPKQQPIEKATEKKETSEKKETAEKEKAAEKKQPSQPRAAAPLPPFPTPPEIVIHPGEMITCQLMVVRNGFKDRIRFEVENLPHGVIVDDIGLSGVLIPAGMTERTLYLSAEDWVGESSRLFHVVAQVEGNQVSLPMMLHVRQTKTETAKLSAKQPSLNK